MKKKADQLLVLGFLAVLFFLTALFMILPKETFSTTENRFLQKTPRLSFESFLSKEFAEQTESYIGDHFPFRQEWVGLKSSAEQFRLQQENNGILRGQQGYLFEKFAEPEYTQITKNVESMLQFAATHADAQIGFMLVPTSSGLYEEYLPPFAPVYAQENIHLLVSQALGTNIDFLDGFTFLRPAAEAGERSLYYRTDHHWTTYGAYLAYQFYADKMGWQPYPETAFDIQTVTDSFLGSYHTRSQFNRLTPDSIQVYSLKTNVPSEMYIADQELTYSSLYDASFLDKKDKYSYFLGGVNALTIIRSKLEPDSVQQDKILVIKDSYAHSFIPFLTLHVPEIHVIDLRYYNGNITDYMEDHEISNVLFLFHTATFVSEQSFVKLRY